MTSKATFSTFCSLGVVVRRGGEGGRGGRRRREGGGRVFLINGCVFRMKCIGCVPY